MTQDIVAPEARPSLASRDVADAISYCMSASERDSVGKLSLRNMPSQSDRQVLTAHMRALLNSFKQHNRKRPAITGAQLAQTGARQCIKVRTLRQCASCAALFSGGNWSGAADPRDKLAQGGCWRRSPGRAHLIPRKNVPPPRGPDLTLQPTPHKSCFSWGCPTKGYVIQRSGAAPPKIKSCRAFGDGGLSNF